MEMTGRNFKKTAAVTGSRRGIGYETARQLGHAGYHVILSGISSAEDTKGIVKELEQEGISAEYFPCNIGVREQREQFFRHIQETQGRLDLHVNNAGVAPKTRMDLLRTTEESFSHVMDINLKGTFFMAQAAANYMIELLEEGMPDYAPRMINISSVSSFASSVNRGEYCISKAGISMITKLFADRLSEYGIPVFEIQPGIIRTDMTKAMTEKYENMIAGGLTPVRRMGEPIDVAKCVLAAAGGSLDFATGQVLHADGGFHIRRL